MVALWLRQPHDAPTAQFGFGLQPVGLRVRPGSGICQRNLVGSSPDFVRAYLAVIDVRACFVGVAVNRCLSTS